MKREKEITGKPVLILLIMKEVNELDKMSPDKMLYAEVQIRDGSNHFYLSFLRRVVSL